MAEGNAGRLNVEFGADLAPLKRELEQGRAKASEFARDVRSAGEAAGGRLAAGAQLAVGAVRALAAAAAIYKGYELSKQAIADAAALERTARAAGLTTQQLQQLSGGARINGFTGDLGPALEQFATTATLARSKMGELYETLKFAAPALASQLAATKTTEQALEVYAEAIRRVNGEEAKAVLAKKAFGDAGVSLLPILSKGAAGLAEMRAEADKYAVNVSDRAIKASKALGTEIEIMAANAKNGLANLLAPALELTADRLAIARGETSRYASDAEKAAAQTKELARSLSLAAEAASSERLKGLADGFAVALAGAKKFREEAAKAKDGYDLQQKPDFRGADAVMQSIQQLAAARGELFKVAQLEGKQAIEAARRVAAEGAMSATEFAKVRQNTEAATAAKILEIRKQTQGQLRQLEIEALTARGEDFQAIRLQYENDLQTYSDMLERKLITEEQFQSARENLNAVAGQRIKDANDRLGEEQRRQYEGIYSALDQAFGSTLTGKFESAEDAARHLGITLADGLRKAITEALILKPLMDAIKGTGGGTGLAGFLGSAMGFPPSANAEGGGVRAGQPTRVNERMGRMPEVFVPSTAGRIIPGERALAMARSGGGGGTTSNIYNINAPGSEAGVEHKIIAALAAKDRLDQQRQQQARTLAHRFPTRR